MYIHGDGGGERRARATRARARVYPLAIKDGETLFKPDTPLEIRPCSDHEIPSVEHNRYLYHGHDTTRGHASTANFFREIGNEWLNTMKTYFALSLSFVPGRKIVAPVFSIILSPSPASSSGKTVPFRTLFDGGTRDEIPNLAKKFL